MKLWDCFQGTQERVRNSRGKRAISVRATEVLLYMRYSEFTIFGEVCHAYCFHDMGYEILNRAMDGQ